jgi:release factor glutamine methyltransferase
LTDIAAALIKCETQLLRITDTPRLDSQVLLGHILGRPRSWVLAHPEYEISEGQLLSLESALQRMIDGSALAHVIGHWEFFGLEFTVTPETLIPRPETELLVEVALDWLAHRDERRFALDVGTGTGCIAVALALQIPDLILVASDISGPALRIARQNSIKHEVDARVHCIQANLLPPLSHPVHLLCANLPYISSTELFPLEVFGKEPTLALDGGTDGLSYIRKLLNSAPAQIAPGGLILIEVESSRGESALRLAKENFPGAQTELLHDLAGLDRLIAIQV